MSESPRFDHDHDDCTFLGQYGDADLYHCVQGGVIPTVIARLSDDPSDYLSGMGGNLGCLVEARRRAEDRGLRIT